MNKRLKEKFFEEPTLRLAFSLLGKYLVRKLPNGKVIEGKITEVEAYCGFSDKASHAARGKTPRCEVMFGRAGRAYIYLIYGMHYCFNIVTDKKDYPAAVLIRSVDGVTGPGRVCKYLKIDKSLNKENLIISKKLWLEDRGVDIKSKDIEKLPRVGIDYAGTCAKRLWRFKIKNPSKSI